MTITASHKSQMVDPEETDLERRVLAHERILQALIAHMAESEPKFFERLTAVFNREVGPFAAAHPTGNTAMERTPDTTLFQLSRRAGIWEITKDGNFYGHYESQQPAFDAVEAAAHAIVEGGGCADILLRGEPPRRMPAARTALSGEEVGR